MSKRDDQFLIEGIADSGYKIISYTHKMSYEEFFTDKN